MMAGGVEVQSSRVQGDGRLSVSVESKEGERGKRHSRPAIYPKSKCYVTLNTYCIDIINFVIVIGINAKAVRVFG